MFSSTQLHNNWYNNSNHSSNYDNNMMNGITTNPNNNGNNNTIYRNSNKRSVSNSNPSLFDNNKTNSDVHVEYELSVPIIQSFRHTPYHSLWDLHHW